MKSTVAIALAVVVAALAVAGCCTSPAPKALKSTYSSFDLPSEHAAGILTHRLTYEFENVALPELLERYEQISGRTVVAGQLPHFNITVRSSMPLNRIEALQMLDTALAQHMIAMVLSGDKMVKAVMEATVSRESPPEITLPWQLLPESSSPMSRTVRLRYLRPSEVLPALLPLAHLPNSMLPLDSQGLLMLRDYSSNIRQQLKLLEQLDREIPVKRGPAAVKGVSSPAPRN